MSVTVRFVNGDEETFISATAATRRKGCLVIEQWNTVRDQLEEVAVFEAKQVAFATVEIIRGVPVSFVTGHP